MILFDFGDHASWWWWLSLEKTKESHILVRFVPPSFGGDPLQATRFEFEGVLVQSNGRNRVRDDSDWPRPCVAMNRWRVTVPSGRQRDVLNFQKTNNAPHWMCSRP